MIENNLINNCADILYEFYKLEQECDILIDLQIKFGFKHDVNILEP